MIPLYGKKFKIKKEDLAKIKVTFFIRHGGRSFINVVEFKKFGN